MAATKYGSGGKYGITSEQGKGLFAQSIGMSANEQIAEVQDHIGETVGAVYYNSSSTITASGATVGANTQGQTLGGILDIASTAIFGTDTPVTKYYVDSVDLTDNNTDFQTGSFTAQGWAGVTASSGTEIT